MRGLSSVGVEIRLGAAVGRRGLMTHAAATSSNTSPERRPDAALTAS
jgi:hypothetical protein